MKHFEFSENLSICAAGLSFGLIGMAILTCNIHLFIAGFTAFLMACIDVIVLDSNNH